MEKLIDLIHESEEFKQHYIKLLKANVLTQLDCNKKESSLCSIVDLNYLLKGADILAFSDFQDDLDKVLRICQAVIVDGSVSNNLKNKALLILRRMGNYPLIELAKTKGVISGEENPDFKFKSNILVDEKIEWNSNFLMSNGDCIKLNKFQQDFLFKADSCKALSVSAPTAAGKSYIFCKYILDLSYRYNSLNILYLVPTRALVSQVSEDLYKELSGKEIKFSINTLPNFEFISEQDINVFVFTQERLHFLMSSSSSYKFDYIFVDEAHKISDSYRGILLQHAILRASSKESSIVFASPFSRNPEKLLELDNRSVPSDYVYTPVATVNQNLFWVEQVPRNPKIWNVKHVSDVKLDISVLELDDSPNTKRKRLSFIAFKIGKDVGGNVVYVDIPSEAENVSLLLVDCLKQSGYAPTDDEDVLELIELCEKTIHKRFLLINTLRYGIAFHYGNLPQLIRYKIESLFKLGKIKFLVCTSTLIEGVNLSCRNIFVRGPKKGRTKGPMSKEDFWNLAGRAGRWGKEFQGNIFCIDVSNSELWPLGAPTKRMPYNIQLSVEKKLNSFDSFVEYLNNKMPREDYLENIETDYLFSYLLYDYYSNGQSNSSLSYLSDENKALLVRVFKNVEKDVSIPRSIILKNPGVSPYAMQELFDYFSSKDESYFKELIPPNPASDKAVEELLKVLSRINKYVSPQAFGFNSGATFVLSLLIVKWMSGYSLARLISDRESYLKRKGKDEKISTTIRTVLDDIENIARFRAPKYLSCYNDVLAYFFNLKGRDDLVISLDDVQLSLEFGVNIKTQLSLISLGISRSSAVEISEFISNSEMTPEQVTSWILSESIENFDLPKLVIREIIEFKESLIK